MTNLQNNINDTNDKFVKDVHICKKKLDKVILNTPLSFAPKLSTMLNANIYLKKENLQKTGSFKIRGAFNKISNLTSDKRSKGVVAASAGNHAQGVAFGAQYYNIPATICMPENTPQMKINGVKNFGANVVLVGNNYDDAYEYAIDLSKTQDMEFIHPFLDKDVVIGQASVAFEILNHKIKNKLDTIIIPIGGGGLVSGMARYIKSIDNTIKVIGVTAKGAPAMYKSFHTKKLSSTSSVKTIADGIAVRKASKQSFDYINSYVDDIVEVDDEEIAYAILYLLEEQKILTEGAGVVGVAALLTNKIKLSKNQNIACVVSGGNIDITMLSVIIDKGLALSYRTMKIRVTLIDKPGSLTILTEVLRKCKANIIQVEYDRSSVHLDYGDANIIISLETKGKTDQEKIAKALTDNGFKFKTLD